MNRETVSNPSRVMGLDIGERRIGVAVSDPLGWTAQGIEVVDRKRYPDWLSRITQLVEEYEVAVIVVGFPRNMDGTVGPRGEACKETSEMLEKRLGIPVRLWDERLSTAAAERSLLAADMSRAKRKKVIDRVAASWILQGYLDAQRGKI